MNLKTFKKELNEINKELKSIHGEGELIDKEFEKVSKQFNKKFFKMNIYLAIIIVGALVCVGMFIYSFIINQELAQCGYLCFLLAFGLWALKIAEEDIPTAWLEYKTGSDIAINKNRILQQRCEKVREKLDKLKIS